MPKAKQIDARGLAWPQPELGRIHMRAFVKTLKEIEPRPGQAQIAW